MIQCADGGLYQPMRRGLDLDGNAAVGLHQPTPRVAEYLARCGVAVGWAASPMPRVDVGGARFRQSSSHPSARANAFCKMSHHKIAKTKIQTIMEENSNFINLILSRRRSSGLIST